MFAISDRGNKFLMNNAEVQIHSINIIYAIIASLASWKKVQNKFRSICSIKSIILFHRYFGLVRVMNTLWIMRKCKSIPSILWKLLLKYYLWYYGLVSVMKEASECIPIIESQPISIEYIRANIQIWKHLRLNMNIDLVSLWNSTG